MLRPFPSSMRAAATTPAEPAGACVARCPAAGSLPRISGGSASASPVSRPARRSLALRPAWSLSRPRGPSSSECFGRYRYLHHPLRLLPAGATVAGRDSHPLGNGAFARRTEKCGLTPGRLQIGTWNPGGHGAPKSHKSVWRVLGRILRPAVHQVTALLEQVRPGVGPLHGASHLMRQSRLGDRMRNIRLLARPVAK